jgi:hypothetical protein
MNTTIGTAQASLTLTQTSTSTDQYFTKFVSSPLNMASISANTWTYNFAAKQNVDVSWPDNPGTTETSSSVCINLYVWRPSTTTKIGTIFDNKVSPTATSASSSTAELAFHWTFSGAAVSSISANDVLIAEIWFPNQFNGTSASVFFYYDGTTENRTRGTTVSNHASFVETPQTLTFTTGEITMTESAAKTYSNKFITKV